MRGLVGRGKRATRAGLAGAVASVLVVGSIAAAVMIDQAAAAGAARADTSPPMTVYVNGAAPNCSDAPGAGTQAQPYCTLQYAANVAVPGQTILGGQTYNPVILTRSGTPTAPITIKAWFRYTGLSTVPLTLDKVHDVKLSGLNIQSGPADDIDVIGSQDITIDSALLGMQPGKVTTTVAVSVDGTSSNVTISRSDFVTYSLGGIRVAAGASDVTITTNNMTQVWPGAPITVTGATGVNLTSNTVRGGCNDDVVLTDTSSATIENNIFFRAPDSTCPSVALTGLSVDAATAATAHSDYNYFPYNSASTAISWAGTSYQDEPTFNAATGQGAHDAILTAPGAPPAGESSPIDSADCTAPGELDTDWQGTSHIDDPLVPNTGLGTCYADRGAAEALDQMPFGFTVSQSVPTTAGTVTVQLSNASGTSSWDEPVTYTANWGDGSPVETIAANGSVAHQYTTAGTYSLTLTAADTSGSKPSANGATVTVYTATAPALTLTASTRNSAGAVTADLATFTAALADPADAWEVKSAQINFGQGASDSESIALSPSAQVLGLYNKPGTYRATLTATDALGRTSTATVNVTVGNLISLMTPVVDYSHTVAAHGTVQLWYNTLHLGIQDQAALITVAVTSVTKPGYVIEYPRGAARPNQATVQFAAGQQVSNVTLATMNEAINFYNASSAPITLTITTIGVEPVQWTTAGDTYVPVAPASVLPATKVAGNHYLAFPVAGSHGVPANAAAVIVDVTASGGTTAGHVVSYPERLPGQQQQVAYWGKGQAVTGFAVVPVNGRVGLRNVGSGTAALSAQVVGYLAPNVASSHGGAFFPSPRARLLVVNLAGKHYVKLPVTGKNGVLAGSRAVMVNLTTTGAAAGGSITAWADGTTRPGVTSLSYTSGQANVNAAIVAVGADGTIDLYNNGLRTVTVVVDLLGSYYAY